MRIIFLLLLAWTVSVCSGQEQFVKQIRTIIKDSTYKFSSYKNGFKELQGIDSVYFSLINVEGTSNNDIFIGKRMTIYRALIIDSIKEKKGKKIVDEWRQKLTPFLAGFNEEKVKVLSYNPAKYGWIYKRGDITIGIDLYPHIQGSSMYQAILSFTYFNMDFINSDME